MKIINLRQLKHPKLGECHPNNVLVRSVSILVMFHANIPLFKGLQAKMILKCPYFTYTLICPMTDDSGQFRQTINIYEMQVQSSQTLDKKGEKKR